MFEVLGKIFAVDSLPNNMSARELKTSHIFIINIISRDGGKKKQLYEIVVTT